MYCIHCGTMLPESAKFCPQCGTQQPLVNSTGEVCRVVFRQIDEKWSLFGKDICRFEAVAEAGQCIAASVNITISGFELGGPNERNRKHRAAFEGLVHKLLAEGWEQVDKTGRLWYELEFRRRSC